MLSLSPELLAITAVVFLSMVYILNKILYRPIFDFLESRKNVSDDYENKIEALSKKVEEYELQSKDLLLKAREEAKQIREEKIREVDLKIEQEVAILKAVIKLTKSEVELLKQEQTDVLNELIKNLPDYSKLVANKIS